MDLDIFKIWVIIDWEYVGFFFVCFEYFFYNRFGFLEVIDEEVDDLLDLFELFFCVI